jgi:hypothetical protein
MGGGMEGAWEGMGGGMGGGMEGAWEGMGG